MAQVLLATEQNGQPFHMATGLNQILVHSLVAGKTYTLQVKNPDDNVWVNTDAEWDEAGLQTFYAANDWEYRIIGEDAASIGAVAFYHPIGR